MTREEQMPDSEKIFRLTLCAALSWLSPACATHQHAADTTLVRPRGPELLEIADLLARRGERVHAAQYLTWAQREGVSEDEVIQRLLALYAADGQYRLAIDVAEHHLQRRPHDRQVQRALGALYLAIDADAAARHTFEQLLRDEPDDAELHYALATLLTAVDGSQSEAETHYRAYLALMPHGRHTEEVHAYLTQVQP